MTRQEFYKRTQGRDFIIEDEVFGVDFNEEEQCMCSGYVYNCGVSTLVTLPYDEDKSFDTNLNDLYEETLSYYYSCKEE